MQAQQPVNQLSLGSILHLLRRKKSVVLMSMAAVTIMAALYAFLKPDQYRAEALISVEPAAARAYLKPSDVSTPINVQEKLWRIRESLFSPDVLEQINQEFRLYPGEQDIPTDWRSQLFEGLRKLLRDASQAFRLIGGDDRTERERKELQLEQLKTRIHIQVEAAEAFSIGFEGKDRNQVTEVTNRLAQLLVTRTAHASEQRAGSAAGFLEAEVNRVKESLDSQKAAIQQYQQRMGDQLPSQLPVHMKLLEALEAQLLSKREEIANDEARLAAVVEEMHALEEQGVLESKALSPSAARLEELRAHLKDLETRYTGEHPEVKATKTQIQDLEKVKTTQINAVYAEPSPAHLRYMQLKAEQQAINRRLNSSKQEEKSLTPQIMASRGKIDATPRHERTLADLTRDYEETREQYQTLLDKQHQAQLEERLEQSTQSSMFRVVRPAYLPLEPHSPRRGRIVLVGIVLGLGLGLALVIFSDYRDTSYKSVEDFREVTNLPVLAVVPTVPAEDERAARKLRSRQLPPKVGSLSLRVSPSPARKTLVTLLEPRSVISEQYGYLAMQLRTLLGNQSSRVISVTSAAGGEGKTVTSVNLSVLLSRLRAERVLLVECDLRKPRILEYLNLPPQKGLADILQSIDDPLEPYLRRVNELTILPGGSLLPNTLEVLSSDRPRKLFERLRREFPCIIVDLPPILPIADSKILAELSDGVILVVRAQQTRRELFQHALEQFKVPNILGVVLNGVDLRDSQYAYAYDYYAKEYLGQGAMRSVTR